MNSALEDVWEFTKQIKEEHHQNYRQSKEHEQKHKGNSNMSEFGRVRRDKIVKSLKPSLSFKVWLRKEKEDKYFSNRPYSISGKSLGKKELRRFWRTIVKSLSNLPEILACVDISEFVGNLGRQPYSAARVRP